jgi:hypothetical protein
MSRNLFTTRVNQQRGSRVSFPNLNHLSDFLVYYSLATQAYESLIILNEHSEIYKLKALKFAKISVPLWLTQLSHAIGNYQSKEGVIRVKALTKLCLVWTVKALEALSNLGAPSLQNLPPVPNNPYTLVWNLSLLEEEFNSSVDFIDLEAFNLELPVPLGDDFRIPLDYSTISLPAYQALIAMGMNSTNTQLVEDFITVRNLDFNQAIATGAFPRSFENAEVNWRTQHLVTALASSIPWFLMNYNNYTESLFNSDVFAPSFGGSQAQTVQPVQPTPSVSDAMSTWSYPMSREESALGFILSACHRSTFQPTYSLFTATSRPEVFSSYLPDVPW